MELSNKIKQIIESIPPNTDIWTFPIEDEGNQPIPNIIIQDYFTGRYEDNDLLQAISIMLENTTIQKSNYDITLFISHFFNQKISKHLQKQIKQLFEQYTRQIMNDYESPVSFTKEVSINITEQKSGDCFAHVFSRVFLKYFKTYYPDLFNPGNRRSSNKYEQNNECDDFYLNPELFYCHGRECRHNELNVKDTCQTDYEYHSLITYMFIYGLIVKQFGCRHGAIDDQVIRYVLTQLYNPELFVRFEEYCVLGEFMCRDVYPIIESNMNNPYEMIHLRRLYTQERKEGFFELIQYTIDQDLYVHLTLPKSIVVWREQKKRAPLPEITNMNTKNHAMVIIDYDYSNPQNRRLIIKNSWGKGYTKTGFKTGVINIFEDDLDQTTMQNGVLIYSVLQNKDLNNNIQNNIDADKPLTKYFTLVGIEYMTPFIMEAINNGRMTVFSSLLDFLGSEMMETQIQYSSSILMYLAEGEGFFIEDVELNFNVLPDLLDLVFSKMIDYNIKIRKSQLDSCKQEMIRNINRFSHEAYGFNYSNVDIPQLKQRIEELFHTYESQLDSGEESPPMEDITGYGIKKPSIKYTKKLKHKKYKKKKNTKKNTNTKKKMV